MTALSEIESHFRYLQNVQNPPLQTTQIVKSLKTEDAQKRAILAFACHYIQLFRGKPLEDNFDPKLFALIEAVQKIFEEIDANLLKGISSYNPSHFSDALFAKIRRYCPGGVSFEIDFFEDLKGYSYQARPFPQRLLGYPDSTALQKVEEIRALGFRVLYSKLEEGERLPLSAGEDLALAKLVYNSGALGAEKDLGSLQEIVYFGDLLATWGEEHLEKRGRIQAIFRELGLRQWSPNQGSVIEKFRQVEGATFQEFLINCTISAFETTFQCIFFSFVEEHLQQACKNEKIRSDLAYFTAVHPTILWQLLQKCAHRPSSPYLEAFYLLNSFIYTYGISPEKRSLLLQMILVREETPPLSPIGPEALPPKSESPLFSESWQCLEDLADGLFWEDPHLLSLLLFLLEQEDPMIFDRWVGLFSFFREDPLFSLSPSLIEAFCRKNSHLSASCLDNFLAECARLREVDIFRLGSILLSPPIEVDSSLDALRQITKKDMEEFHRRIGVYQFSETQVDELLRRRIFDSKNFTVMLDIAQQNLLRLGRAAFYQNPWNFLILQPNFDPLPSALLRKEVERIVVQLQKRYLFSFEQCFELYLELLHLKGDPTGEGERILERTSAFVLKLRDLFFDLSPTHFFFFFRYHPDPPPFAEIFEVVKAKKAFIEASPSDDEFYFDPIQIADFEAVAKRVAHSLAEFCPLGEREGYEESFITAFRTSVLLYLDQPVTDFFQIVDINEQDHIQFIGPEPRSHLGQLKDLLPLSSRSLYVNWNWFNGLLELTFTAYNKKKRSAFSASAHLPLEREEIDPEDRKGAFFGFLLGASKSLFSEPSVPVANDPSFNYSNLPADLVKKGWEFLQRAKVAYRNVLLQRPASLPLSSLEIAAQGNIYPTARGSLLPEFRLQTEARPHCYLPDADGNFLEEYRNLFSKSCPEFAPLKLKLSIEVDGKEKKIDLFYKVQTLADLQNDPSIVGGPFYVTLRFALENPKAMQSMFVPFEYPREIFRDLLLFQERFDRHNLQIKAAALREQLTLEKVCILEEEEKAQ